VTLDSSGIGSLLGRYDRVRISRLARGFDPMRALRSE
jgi:hypothetical protein